MDNDTISRYQNARQANKNLAGVLKNITGYAAPETFEPHTLDALSQTQRNARYFLNDLHSIGASKSTWDAATRNSNPFVSLYQTSMFKPINAYLRQGEEGLRDLDKSVAGYHKGTYPEFRYDVGLKAANIIPNIQDELNTLPVYDEKWVHRGIPVANADRWLKRMGYEPGAIISDPAFLSTSSDRNMANTFAFQNYGAKESRDQSMDTWKRNVAMDQKHPGSVTDIWGNPLDLSKPDFSPIMLHIQSKTGRVAPVDYIDQKEIIFQPNTNFQVDKIQSPLPGRDNENHLYNTWRVFLNEV